MDFKICVIIFLIEFSVFVRCQSDGGFWWLNRDVMKGVKESREIKNNNLKSKVRTLPPSFYQETSTPPPRNSIFDDDEDEDMFKDNNQPDCVCEKRELCDKDNYLITDGTGIIDERAFNICGVGNVCCRVNKKITTTSRPTTTVSTRKPFFNLQNILSTVLKPVTSLEFHPKPVEQCVSRKGKKIQERILLDDYDEDDDDVPMVGETSFGEYPWMLAILKRVKKTATFEYKCGGTLISMKSALTAHHCLSNTNSRIKAENYQVRAGEWDRATLYEIIGHQDRQVNQIISHPQYYSGGLFNDIAIIKWQVPFEKEINVAPICLPDVSDNFDRVKTYCIVTGWGKVSEDETKADKLKFVKVPLVDRTTCQVQLQKTRLGSRFRLHDSFICAGGEENRDSCDGDGGSPMICPRQDGSFVLSGLVSWGIGCGQKNVPAAYTNIKFLLDWIKTNDK